MKNKIFTWSIYSKFLDINYKFISSNVFKAVYLKFSENNPAIVKASSYESQIFFLLLS